MTVRETVTRSRTLSQVAAGALVVTIWILALAPNQAISSNRFTLAVAVCIGCLLYALNRGGRIRQPRGLLLLIGAQVAIFCSTILYGDGTEVLSSTRFAVLLVLIALTAAQVNRDDRTVIYRTVIVLAVVETVIAVSEKLRGGPVIWGWLGNKLPGGGGPNTLWESPPWRAPATMGHGIPLGLLLAVGFLFVLLTQTPRRVVPRAVVLGLFLLGIGASGSRSAVVVLLVALLIVVFTQRTVISTIPARLAVAVAVIYAAYTVNFSTLSAYQALQNSASLQNRQNSLSSAGNLFDLSPFQTMVGNGWGSSARLSEAGVLPAARQFAVDNNFVTLLATGGLIALALTVWMFVRGFLRGDVVTRAGLLVVVGMFMSFDISEWAFPSALLVCLSYLSEGSGSLHHDARHAPSETAL